MALTSKAQKSCVAYSITWVHTFVEFNLLENDLTFSFDFAPRDLSEAQEIKKIIHCLKRNMVPNNEPSGNINFFLQTPNIFELKYKTGNKDHGFLNRFKIAALKNISVNYAGSGTYMTYNDKDKTPVHMQMNLQFQELVPLYQSDYKKDDENLENVGY